MTQITSHGGIGRRSVAHIVVRLFGLVLLLGSSAGCAGVPGQTFMVQFMPFSSTPVGQGQATVQAAIAYANAHPLAAACRPPAA